MILPIKYTFYYPAKTIGGAQLLFARVAAKMAKEGFDVTIIEEDSNFISGYLNDLNVNFSSFLKKKDVKYSASENEVFILAASYISLIKNSFEMQPNTKLFFWDLHPFALVEQLGFSGLYKKENFNIINNILLKTIEKKGVKTINEFIKTAIKYNGFAFMCGKNEVYNRRFFDFEHYTSFLPIPIDLKPNFKTLKQVSKDDFIRITWLGRLDKDKINLVDQLIQDLAPYKVMLNIIGSGDAHSLLQDRVSSNTDLKISWLGALQGRELDEIIRDSTDFGVAIGTSSLEFARRGVASLLMPGVNEIHKFGKNKYQWIFNSSKGNLCTILSSKLYCRDINSIIIEFNKNREEYGKMSYEYAEYNHSFDEIYSRLKKQLSYCEFTYEKFENTGVNEMHSMPSNKLKRLYKKIISE